MPRTDFSLEALASHWEALQPVTARIRRGPGKAHPRREARRGFRRLAWALLATSIVLADPATAAAPEKLEYLELGPLRLRNLSPGTLTILPQQRIRDNKVYRRFKIAAQSGYFEYLASGAEQPVLAGPIAALKIDGYIHLSTEDNIESMFVEGTDKLTFILRHDRYRLPTYGGGAITLNQPQVWVGNEGELSLTQQTGRIYFATDGVAWRGIQLGTRAPDVTIALDARSIDPARGVRFVLDLASAKLALQAGNFISTAWYPSTAIVAPEATLQYRIDAISGRVGIAVERGEVVVSPHELKLRMALTSLEGPQRTAVVAGGDLSLSADPVSTSLQAERIQLPAVNLRKVGFVPAPRTDSETAAWQDSGLAQLLTSLGLADPERVREKAIDEAAQKLAGVGRGRVFLSVRRTLLETLLAKHLESTSVLSAPSLTFAPQSIALRAEISSPSPFGGEERLTWPIGGEVTVGIKDSALVLRPVARMLLLGRFEVSAPLRLEDLLPQLRDNVLALLQGSGQFLELTFPVNLNPAVDFDLGALSGGALTVTSKPYRVGLALDPAILIRPEAIWIFSGAEIK